MSAIFDKIMPPGVPPLSLFSILARVPVRSGGIALVGFHHAVSFFANGLRLAPEPFAAPSPAA